MEGSPREPANGCSDQAELRTENERNRMEGSPCEPAHGCSNQAELGTGIRTHPPRRAWKVRPANRRTVAPTKPNLERKMNAPAPPGMEGSPREPANGCSDQAELRTENECTRMEGSTCEPAHGCSNQAELRTEKECNRVDTSFCCNLNLKDERNEKTENPQHRKRVG